VQIVRRAESEAALLTGAIRAEEKRAHKRIRVTLCIKPSARIKFSPAKLARVMGLSPHSAK
jgi:hypothetical protein